MISLGFNKNTYEVPGKWEELSQPQYLQFLKLIFDFLSGKYTLIEFRAMAALIVTGLKPRRFRDSEKQVLQSENLYRIGCEITFPLRVEYENQIAFDKLRKPIRDLLYRCLPEELDQTLPEVRWAKSGKKHIVPDLVFARNLVPEIVGRRKRLQGYSFNLEGKILATSLTASQYIEAQTVYNEFLETGDRDTLNLLIAILYCPEGFDQRNILEFSKTLGWVGKDVAEAIFINFLAIQHFIAGRTKYSILFDSTPVTKRAKHNTGLAGVAYSLMKAGYQDVDNMPLVKFFEILYSNLVSAVTDLSNADLPIDKIAEKTGLSIAKINQIL